jgi:hypothetical protein
MGKQLASPSGRGGPPVWVWILIGVVVLAVLTGGSLLAYRMLQGTTDAEPLPSTAELPALPRPELPERQPLPAGPQTPSLPDAPGLPQTEKSERSLPHGPSLPETEAAAPKPSGPSGAIYYAATVQPYQVNMPGITQTPGMQFVTSLYKIVNKSTISVRVDHNLTALSYQNRTYYPYVWASGMDAIANRRFLSEVTLAPNSMTEGYVGFQLPIGASDVKPLFMPQGIPSEIRVVRVSMDQLPSLQGPAPTQTLP